MYCFGLKHLVLDIDVLGFHIKTEEANSRFIHPQQYCHWMKKNIHNS